MTPANGYKNGKFMSAASVRPGCFDIFEMDESGQVIRHFGTFTSGSPKDTYRHDDDAIAIVDGLAAKAK